MQAFGKDDEKAETPVVNTGSYFSGLSSLISYTGSQWSFAQVRVSLPVHQITQTEAQAQPESESTRHTKVIVIENKVVVATHHDDKNLIVCANLSEQGGECKVMS